MYKLILYLAFLIIFFSCSTNTNSTQELDLSGTWQLTSWTTDIPYDFNEDGDTSTNLFDQLPSSLKNSGYILTENNDNYFSAKIINTNSKEFLYPNSYTFFRINFENQTLEITQKYGGPLVFSILSMTQNELIFETVPLSIASIQGKQKSISTFKRI